MSKPTMTRCQECSASVDTKHLLAHLRWHTHINACLDIAAGGRSAS